MLGVAEIATTLVDHIGILSTSDKLLPGQANFGNVFKRTTDIELGQLRSAAGFGVRFQSPIGPFEFAIEPLADRLRLDVTDDG